MKRVLFVAALCAATAYLGLTRLASVVAAEGHVVLVDQLQEDEVLYSTPEPEVVASLAGKLELLAFTYKTTGVCGACDMARPAMDSLCDEYPITRVYYDTPKGANVALEYAVRALPTFVLVRRQPNGKATEIERFSGGYSRRQFAARVEAMFRRAGYDADSAGGDVTGARPIPKLERLRAPASGRWVWIWY